MIEVITEIQIEAPLEKVFAYSANPDNAPSWYVNIKSVAWQTPKPIQIGTRVAFMAKFLGQKLFYVYEFIELIPDKKLIMRTSEGPFPMETTYIWEPVNDHTTRMILKNRGVPKGFSKLLSPSMKAMMKRANEKDLKKLKSILEH